MRHLVTRLFVMLLAATTINLHALAADPYYVFCLTSAEANSQFDPSGAFSIQGKAPKGFEGFDTLFIEATESKQNRDGSLSSVPIKPRGEVNFKGGRRYKMKSINLSDDQLSFETVTVRGVSYQFTGRFLKKENFYETQPSDPVLKGRLVKLLNGKKVIEAQMTFYFEPGD